MSERFTFLSWESTYNTVSMTNRPVVSHDFLQSEEIVIHLHDCTSLISDLSVYYAACLHKALLLLFNSVNHTGAGQW